MASKPLCNQPVHQWSPDVLCELEAGHDSLYKHRHLSTYEREQKRKREQRERTNPVGCVGGHPESYLCTPPCSNLPGVLNNQDVIHGETFDAHVLKQYGAHCGGAYCTGSSVNCRCCCGRCRDASRVDGERQHDELTHVSEEQADQMREQEKAFMLANDPVLRAQLRQGQGKLQVSSLVEQTGNERPAEFPTFPIGGSGKTYEGLKEILNSDAQYTPTCSFGLSNDWCFTHRSLKCRHFRGNSFEKNEEKNEEKKVESGPLPGNPIRAWLVRGAQVGAPLLQGKIVSHKICDECGYQAWAISAETGDVLYCVVCDARSRARDFYFERDDARKQVGLLQEQAQANTRALQQVSRERDSLREDRTALTDQCRHYEKQAQGSCEERARLKNALDDALSDVAIYKTRFEAMYEVTTRSLNPTGAITEHHGSKYLRTIHSAVNPAETIQVDVYNVTEAFNVTCPGRQHALKKLLCSGIRGKGSQLDDLVGTQEALSRAIEMQTIREREAGNFGSELEEMESREMDRMSLYDDEIMAQARIEAQEMVNDLMSEERKTHGETLLLLQSAQEEGRRVTELSSNLANELAAVDRTLGNARAFEQFSTRSEKIAYAMKIAAMNDPNDGSRYLASSCVPLIDMKPIEGFIDACGGIESVAWSIDSVTIVTQPYLGWEKKGIRYHFTCDLKTQTWSAPCEVENEDIPPGSVRYIDDVLAPYKELALRVKDGADMLLRGKDTVPNVIDMLLKQVARIDSFEKKRE